MGSADQPKKINSMKNFGIYVALIVVMFLSCSKDDDDPKDKIVGKWNYLSMRQKTTDPNDSSNNKDETTLKTDDSFIEFKSDDTSNSKYAEKSSNPIYTYDETTYTVSGDKLTLIYDVGIIKIPFVFDMQFTSDNDLMLHIKDDNCELNTNGDIGTCETWLHLTK